MRAAPDSWEWLVLGAVVYMDLGLGMDLFCGLSYALPLCVPTGTWGQTQLQTAPTTEALRAGGVCAGRWEWGPLPWWSLSQGG